RGCEFIMKDAYSFDRDQEGLDKSYASMFEAYKKIFTRMGLNFVITEADPGVMGGNLSHEFMIPADSGEDVVLVCHKCGFAQTGSQEDVKTPCPKCKTTFEKKQAIEVGHIFKLGTKYSKVQGAQYLDSNGKQHVIIMGCYGIGVSRLISAIIEQHHDAHGIQWPFEVAPFKVIIVPVKGDASLMEIAKKYYIELQGKGIDVLLDDRDVSAGVKFKDADLVGIPLSIIIGEKNLKDGNVEIKIRADNKTQVVDRKKAIESIVRLL
ncbi:His/Gly/Thr/Pro-type tRNA ligase C-terminal domain-containing protein, partial [Candidatus Omnitrophota bacterium]